MWVSILFVISIIISVSHAGEDNYDLSFNNFEDVNEGSPCEVKISAVLRNEIAKLNDVNKKILESLEVMNRKLDASEKKMHEKFDEFEIKFNVLGKRDKEFEENLHEKLHKQEKKIIDKLEEYIEEKLDSLEKHMYRKIDALEKITADKTDITVINHKLDAWRNIQPNLEENNTTCKYDKLPNLTLEKVNHDIAQKLNTIEVKILDLENTTSYFNFDKLDYLKNLEGNVNSELTKLKKMIPDMEQNISVKLDALNNLIPENLVERINLKFDTVQKSMLNITENISCKFDNNILNDTVTQFIKRIDEESSKKKNQPEGYWDCKQQNVSGYHFNPTSMDSFDHAKYEISESDGVTNFETHFAIKSARSGHILLSSMSDPGVNDGYFAIDIGDSSNSQIRIRRDRINDYGYEHLHYIDTPNILSASRFTAFYIKISNGTLELRQVGSSSPSLKYTDDGLKTVKYIVFTSWDNLEATYLYDCPRFKESVAELNRQGK